MNIVVNPLITPVFTQISPLCQFSTPPALPASSANSPAITGTWNPASINTSNPGTTTYTFTPSAGQCATSTKMNIVVEQKIILPSLQIGPLCQNSIAPALPAISMDGITGKWSPAVINTATPGSTRYTFTPDNPAQCASPTSMVIAIIPQTIPTFTQIGPLLQFKPAPALPLISNNGITGTWSPSVINTSLPDTVKYTFTPDNSAQCAIKVTMNIIVYKLEPPEINCPPAMNLFQCTGIPKPIPYRSYEDFPQRRGKCFEQIRDN